jgi:hypothetical protein
MSSILDDIYSTDKSKVEKQVVAPVNIYNDTPTAIPTISKSSGVQSSILDDIYSDREEVLASQADKNIIKNPAVREAAVRFVRDRLGRKDLSEDEAVDEYIEHFREFGVNELVAGGDYNYVSAAANDATGGTNLDNDARERAGQRLSDYRLLYQTYNEMPAFSDGFWKATGDYTEGLLKAPSTYVGLLLPGIGKGSGVAATQAAKIGVQRTLMQALKTPVSTIANKAVANPLKTTMFVEGSAASLQNIAQQKTEMELDLRDDYSYSETGLVFGVGAAAPIAVAPNAIKGLVTDVVEEGSEELSETALKAVAKKNEEATIKAEKVLKENNVLAEQVSSTLRPLDPEKVKAGREKFADIADEKGISQIGDKEGLAKTLGAKEEDISITSDFVLSLDKNRTKRIFGASVEILAKSDDGLLENERITEGVARVIRGMNDKKSSAGDKFYKDILEKYNLTSDDFANMFMADVSDAARLLQQAGAAKKTLEGAENKIFTRLNAVAADSIFALDDTAKDSIERLGKAIEDGDVRKITESSKELAQVQQQGWLRSLDTLRLAAMTSQAATTIRNTVSGVTRVGFDVLTRGLDRGIDAAVSKIAGKQIRQAPNEDIFAVAYGLINKRETEAVSEIFTLGFHTKASQLFRELQDIPADAAAGGRVMRMRGLARELNALNTMSDNMFKRAAFVSSLKRQLNDMYNTRIRAGESLSASDFNLRNIMREGNFNKVFGEGDGKQVLDKAVKDALYFTYQKSPDSPTARAFIQGMHKYPFLTTSLVPFPRFVANAMRFTYEYSPLYIMEGAKRSLFRDENNYEEISKALVGTGMIAGAMAFRNSEYAGDNWWEGKTASGDTYDLRPFFPAAPYLFVADLINRGLKGDPLMGDRSFITDSIQALTGTQFRAGFGIYAIDSALNDVFRDDIDAYQKAATIGANFGANIASTFTIPLTLGQDMYNTFLAPDDERIVRETRTSDILQLIVTKSLARIPGNYAIENYLADSLGIDAREIYEVPTREEPLRRKTPIMRQVSGILLNERKNFLEEELARLKISNRILSQKTGVPEADTLINSLIGEYATDYLVPKLQNSDKYKEMSAAEQKEYIRQLIKNYKGDIMQLVKYRSRRSGKDRYGFDPMERVAFNRFTAGVQERALSEYHTKFGKPQGDEFYDYERLVDIAEKVRTRGF